MSKARHLAFATAAVVLWVAESALGQGLKQDGQSGAASGLQAAPSTAERRPLKLEASTDQTTLTDAPPVGRVPSWSVFNGLDTESMCIPCAANRSLLLGLSPIIDRRFAYASRDGSSFSAGVIGSRPARAPLFFSAPIGASTTPSVPTLYIDPLAAFNQWSLTVSGSKTVPSPSKNFGLSLVGDLFVPVVGKPTGSPVGPSRTVRGGVKIDY